jgi:hypothetical protein
MKKLELQLQQIQDLYDLSQKDIELIKWVSDYPEYPDSIVALMNYIARSDWLHSHYNKFDKNELFANISNANFEKIMAAFTYICRSEKWVTGSWKDIMENNAIMPILDRANELFRKRNWLQKLFPIKLYGPSET